MLSDVALHPLDRRHSPALGGLHADHHLVGGGVRADHDVYFALAFGHSVDQHRGLLDSGALGHVRMDDRDHFLEYVGPPGHVGRS